MRAQTTLRLSMRMPEKLEKLIRQEAECKGISMNQMMLTMLHRYIQSCGSKIGPCSDS